MAIQIRRIDYYYCTAGELRGWPRRPSDFKGDTTWERGRPVRMDIDVGTIPYAAETPAFSGKNVPRFS
jgi:hypothetical protein